MTWTYDVGKLATSPLMQVRRMIGDVLPGEQKMQDEEINYILTQYSNTYSAAAEVCRNLSAQYAMQVDLVTGELKTNHSARSRRFAQLAADLEMRGLRGALPYAGGISVADKDNVAQDTDRVPPDFNRGQFDDLIPVSPVGEQTPSPRMPDTDSIT